MSKREIKSRVSSSSFFCAPHARTLLFRDLAKSKKKQLFLKRHGGKVKEPRKTFSRSLGRGTRRRRNFSKHSHLKKKKKEQKNSNTHTFFSLKLLMLDRLVQSCTCGSPKYISIASERSL